jgi:hypothetical protein
MAPTKAIVLLSGMRRCHQVPAEHPKMKTLFAGATFALTLASGAAMAQLPVYTPPVQEAR